jgi:hypothetical protein
MMRSSEGVDELENVTVAVSFADFRGWGQGWQARCLTSLKQPGEKIFGENWEPGALCGINAGIGVGVACEGRPRQPGAGK